MYDKLKLLKTDFSKNVFTLVKGTTVAQLLPIVVSPLLTRIYTPEQFGIFSLFLSITAITTIIVNARYEQAIVVEKDEKKLVALIKLSLIISSVISLLLLLIIWLLFDHIIKWLSLENYTWWLFLIPLYTFGAGLYNVLNYYNVRLKEFRIIANSSVLKSTVISVTQIIFGFLLNWNTGLIIGHFIGVFSGNSMLYKKAKKTFKQIPQVKISQIKQVAKEYHKFPKFSLPGALLNTSYLNLTNVLISALFMTTTLGFYSLAKRLIGLPSLVLGSAVNQVFFQRLSEAKMNNPKSMQIIFKNSVKRMTFLALPVFLFVFITVKPAFYVVFGKTWEIAGVYAMYLVPLAFSRFINTSVANTMVVINKQEVTLFVNITQFILMLIMFWFSQIFKWDFTTLLLIFSISFSLLYFISIWFYWFFLKRFIYEYIDGRS